LLLSLTSTVPGGFVVVIVVLVTIYIIDKTHSIPAVAVVVII
jgi:hypothetical protein